MNMLWARMPVEVQTPVPGRPWVEVLVVLDQAAEKTEEEHTVDLGVEPGVEVEAEAEIPGGIGRSDTVLATEKTEEHQRMISISF